MWGKVICYCNIAAFVSHLPHPNAELFQGHRFALYLMDLEPKQQQQRIKSYMMVWIATEGSVAARYLVLVTTSWCSTLPRGFLCIGLLFIPECMLRLFCWWFQLFSWIDYALLISRMKYPVFNSKKNQEKRKNQISLLLWAIWTRCRSSDTKHYSCHCEKGDSARNCWIPLSTRGVQQNTRSMVTCYNNRCFNQIWEFFLIRVVVQH